MDVTNTIRLSATRDQVWRQLIVQGDLKVWLGAETLEIDLFEERTFAHSFMFEDTTIQVVGEVALLVPPNRFGLTWMERKGKRDLWRAPTRLLFELEDNGPEALLTIRHEGFNTIGPEFQHDAYSRYLSYWNDKGRIAALKRIFN